MLLLVVSKALAFHLTTSDRPPCGSGGAGCCCWMGSSLDSPHAGHTAVEGLFLCGIWSQALGSYCLEVFCLCKLPSLSPLAGEVCRLFGNLFYVPVSVSGLLASPVPSVGCVRGKENPGSSPLSYSWAPGSLASLFSTLCSIFLCFFHV